MLPLCRSPYIVMLLFEGGWNLSRPFLSYLDFACWPFPVQLLVRAPYDRVLPHYKTLLSTSCWMMGECLNSLLPVDFIPSTSDHLFWDWSLESFWVPWDLQSSVASSLSIDSFWEYINVPWSMDPLKCFTSTHLFTLVSLHSSTLIPIFIICGWSHVF